jgi:hypothetical protein
LGYPFKNKLWGGLASYSQGFSGLFFNQMSNQTINDQFEDSENEIGGQARDCSSAGSRLQHCRPDVLSEPNYNCLDTELKTLRI